MIKYLINRPIAVFMAFLAFFILGVITYLHIPISLLPNIPIPEITVQISGKNMSAQALENTMVSPIRRQLLQVSHIRDIHSEAHNGHAIIRLNFSYGQNTDLAFIEVNEKIDAAMNHIPREIERPRVVKASATDIPVFFLHLTLNEEKLGNRKDDEQGFLVMSELANTVIKKRIEQLPEVAMVDITGIADKQILVTPKQQMLEITGITLSDISSALEDNNIEPGATQVKDGHYAYNINFSSVVRTLEDIQELYIRKNGRIFQLQDIADMEVVSQQEKGVALYNGHRAVSMGIIKQDNENMSNLQEALESTIGSLKRTYPEIQFSTTQNQTELLDYTIVNLQQNLILAFVFVCLVSIFFMRDVRSPLIIGISMFVSLIISLLFFYLCNISLNIVSLTGLILALGMMIDNSIIVTDNIGQYRLSGSGIDEACIKGTNEVILPMLSSSFTTIAVFVPLIFMSGIAGALFFDQAFSVTVGLLVSYLTGILLLPVLYKLIYGVRIPGRRSPKPVSVSGQGRRNKPAPERIYHRIADWVFSHKAITVLLILAIFPLSVWLFFIIPKEKMPEISQHELLVKIEWNENIHLEENQKRSKALIEHIQSQVTVTSALIGQQQFLLNSEREHTVSESEIYMQAAEQAAINGLQDSITRYLEQDFPQAILAFMPTGSIFERIFATAEPDLRLEYYPRNQVDMPGQDSIIAWQSRIHASTGYPSRSVPFQKQMDIQIDHEKLLLYNVPYHLVNQSLKTGFKEEEITTLRSYQQYLPVVLGKECSDVRETIQNTLLYIPGSQREDPARNVPLKEFVNIEMTEGMKYITAGRNGEFIPFELYDVAHPEETWKKLQDQVRPNNERDIGFSGAFFFNQKMLDELLVILLVSIMLMYFILAAQFESFVQPLIVLMEIPIAIAAALGLLMVFGYSLNLMSAIGIIVTSGIIINDSILKLDIMNQLRKQGGDLMVAIHEAGRRRLNAILMTSMTTIVCMLPLLFSNDMGSELEKPLAVATIGGMLIGTPISLFVVPLVYWFVYRKKAVKI
ncbi:efflux RND transporter permease subunit [Sphingobacterium haloxyli]|uniref:Cation transporter n=1 Tax=Sphingobacterium haloxyli TaxID=2100533 RepID=A0A2S9IZZ5_9SPHI|nr:efflux RND transporter permease subunit [Sphingobacterium haloxyli]PRD46107.1 cation transporter [Sphingobacterium haloxyli]